MRSLFDSFLVVVMTFLCFLPENHVRHQRAGQIHAEDPTAATQQDKEIVARSER